MDAAPLFHPFHVGDVALAHRVVMAPLTRCRAIRGTHVPQPMNAEYYGQRASEGGLQVTEATSVHRTGHGYINTPGIYTEEQVNGWKAVTDAVHAKGGKIFVQLWHVGRVSHTTYQENGALPLAPSAVKIRTGEVFGDDFKNHEWETPQAMTHAQIDEIVHAFGVAARNAVRAGFDGVEVHGANGYLIEQFLEDNSNQRNDEYGGSYENRTRFLIRVLHEVVAAIGTTRRVGVRLSPWGVAGDMDDSNRKDLFTFVVRRLSQYDLAYIHIIEPVNGLNAKEGFDSAKTLVDAAGYKGPLLSAGGYTRETAIAAVKEGRATAVVFGRFFIANPDLPLRLRENAPLNDYDRSTFYGGNEKGYTDYPTLKQLKEGSASAAPKASP